MAEQPPITNNPFPVTDALAAAPWGAAAFDHCQALSYANPAFLKQTGLSRRDLGRKLYDLEVQYPKLACFKHFRAASRSQHSQRIKYQTQLPSGRSYWEEAVFVPLAQPGCTPWLLGFFQDITHQIQNQKKSTHLASHDWTDLPNRNRLSQALKGVLKQARASRQKVAVVLVDVDRFKNVNDTLGYTAGDHVIRQVAARLRQQLAPQDLLAHMSGDEFILLLPYLHGFKETNGKLRGLAELFFQPFTFGAQSLHLNVSMGVSLFPEDGEDMQTLLKHAAAALYDAKKSGRNHHKFYTAKLDHSTTDLATEMSLRRALERGHLRLHYQPQVSLHSGKISAVEALVRWHDPERGLIMPDQFIPLAEETGLIVPLGEWVLQEACRQNSAWQKAGLPAIKMAVNFSVRQFQEPELVEMILNTCRETGMNPEWLDVEITESLLLHDHSVTRMVLHWLLKKGMTITLDDFGTGYSSLKYLQQFPIHTIKIDRAFMRDVQSNPDDAALVATICSIAKNLKKQVVAEGIETEAQLAFSLHLGCDAFQGYYFSKPLPAQEMTQWLQEGRSIPIPGQCDEA